MLGGAGFLPSNSSFHCFFRICGTSQPTSRTKKSCPLRAPPTPPKHKIWAVEFLGFYPGLLLMVQKSGEQQLILGI